MFPFSKPHPKTSLERIGSSLRDVGHDINNLLNTLGSEASGYSSEVKDCMSSFATQAQATGRQLEDQAAHGYESITDFVKRRPVESVALAFGLGMLLVALKRPR
ncbi:hypothetical protein [Verrucomicrobium sp. BvORR034]|jgi:ElaB/YqjD/DUF883 family membrane-anchored ribosome-binding protein|uniref:DUF883 family protein n=1 Tax=Verrucomicrobium sp. BvORR034 TaxID=1396418 RepID=UPI000679336A|nr:hypothetical protein [Verrucomicrobium sp. BvORR034]